MTNFNELTQEQLERMNKKDLILLIQEATEQLNQRRKQKSNKKYDALAILQRGEPISILDISNEMNISTKNVSSLLCYLRKDGHTIHTDDQGRKYLLNLEQ